MRIKVEYGILSWTSLIDPGTGKARDRRDPPRPDNAYTEVAEFGPEDIGASASTETEELLERVFRTMNCVTGNADEEICVRVGVRSMSVGDRVVLMNGEDRKIFLCDSFGWTPMAA